MVFEEYLIELLLTVILMFNVGAYSLLWRKMRRLEEEQSKLEKTINNMKQSMGQIWDRFFGHEEDPTADGFLVESESRFDEIDDQLERICRKIDEGAEERKEEHRVVRSQLGRLVTELHEEDVLNIDEDDFEF